MRVRQYAYFLIRSETVPLADTTAQLGMEPDKVRRKGSRTSGPPPLPRSNHWIVTSGCPDTAPLDEHFDALLVKLQPHTDTICAFLASAAASGSIPVHRTFSSGAEEDRVVAPRQATGAGERLRGQHPLLGFVLGHELIEFAARTRVVFDFDEYGDEDM